MLLRPPTALVSAAMDSDALTEGMLEGRESVMPLDILVSIESDVVGTLAGVAGLIVVLGAVVSVLMRMLEYMPMLGVGVTPERLMIFVSMLNDRDPVSVDGRAGYEFGVPAAARPAKLTGRTPET